LTPPTPPPPPGLPLPNGPLSRWLAHPGAYITHLLHAIAHFAAGVAVNVGPAAAGIALAAGAVVVGVRRRHAATRARGARLVVVELPPEVDRAGAETFWTNLVALLRPAWPRAIGAAYHVGFELTADEHSIQIAIWVPGPVPPGFIERAVTSAWPGSRTRTIDATPPPPPPAAAVTGGQLRLAAADHYPLRTDHRADPMRALLGALAGLEPGHTACVQILARPLTGRRLTRPYRAAAARRAGQPASRSGRLLNLATPGPAGRSQAGRASPVDPTRDRDVAAILDKAAQPAWAVTLRYAIAATATTTGTDRAAQGRLRGRAHAIASAYALYAGRNRLDRRRLNRPAQAIASRRIGRGNLVSVAELAALAHLPTDLAVAGVARAGAKPVAPPPAIPETGKVIGDAETGSARPVAVSVADARMHLHVMGSTGSGKSTLLCRLAVGDIAAGRGVVVIDPKGDLVNDILARYPKGAPPPVIVDPDDRDAPPVLNVLDVADPAERDLVVDNVVGIFRRIFDAYWGPRTDDILRAACLTLIHHAGRGGQPATLADVPLLLQEGRFRRAATAGIAFDRAGLGGFWTWYESLSESGQAQVVGPVMNKLRAFLLRDFVRAVMGPLSSSFSMPAVLDGGVLLARVSKGALGEEASRLLGSFVLANLWQAATHRARLGETARTDAACYIDECQNFLNLPRSLEEMLAEARGYRLSLVLAHQHLAQLPRALREAVSANARNKIYFAASAEDAHALAPALAPEVTEHDLANLGRHQAACRLVADGGDTPAFTVATRAPEAGSDRHARAVRHAARLRYGRNSQSRAERLLHDTAGEAFPGSFDEIGELR
jgi:hypothetical protein